MQAEKTVNPKKTGVRYIHVFGNDLFDSHQYSTFPFSLEILEKIHSIHRVGHGWENKGGYTIRIDHDVQGMAISLCSFKDQFSRPKGRYYTDERASAVGTAGKFRVLTPFVLGESIMEKMRLSAIHHCFQLWMKFGWPIENFVVSRERQVITPSILMRAMKKWPTPGVVTDVQEADVDTGTAEGEAP